MAKGWRTVNIRETRLKDLHNLFEDDRRRPKTQEFSGWLDNLLLVYAEFQKELKQYGPFIEYKDANENIIYLYDHRIKSSVDVYINGKKKKLECESDNTDCCAHVGFCFAIPEVYKVLIEAGFKEPKS
jgi:hypothetical protein